MSPLPLEVLSDALLEVLAYLDRADLRTLLLIKPLHVYARQELLKSWTMKTLVLSHACLC